MCTNSTRSSLRSDLFLTAFTILFPSAERLEVSKRQSVVPCVRHRDIFLADEFGKENITTTHVSIFQESREPELYLDETLSRFLHSVLIRVLRLDNKIVGTNEIF